MTGGRDDERDEWKRQLGTMWRMASSGLDTLRDMVVRSSQEGRLRVDLALYHRERRELFAEIGQTVVGLVDAGRLELPEELKDLVERLRFVDERIQMDSARVQDNAFGAPRGYEPEAASGSPEEDEGESGPGEASERR